MAGSGFSISIYNFWQAQSIDVPAHTIPFISGMSKFEEEEICKEECLTATCRMSIPFTINARSGRSKGIGNTVQTEYQRWCFPHFLVNK